MTKLVVNKNDDGFVALDSNCKEYFTALSLDEINQAILDDGYIFDGEFFIKNDEGFNV